MSIYDTTTDLGKVRLLITDTDIDNAIFTDDEINVFLDMTAYDGENDIRLAAAEALDVIARSEALVQKRIKLLDLQTDGPAVAESLIKSAERLRELANVEVDVDWAEWGLTAFNKREIILKDALRNE